MANCRLIDESDAVLANMTPFRGPSTDVGTAWEIGYAFAHGKPVIGYSEDLSLYHEKVHLHGWSHEAGQQRDRNDHEIEMFGDIDNLMLTQSVLTIAPSFEAAVEILREQLKKGGN